MLALVIGIIYGTIGIVFAWPTSHVHLWRAAAWILSAVLYAAHIAHERFRLDNPPRRAALHVAGAVAIGAFLLALSASLRSVLAGAPEHHTRLVRIALVAWPVLTATPAFVVALLVGAALVRLPLTSRASR